MSPRNHTIAISLNAIKAWIPVGGRTGTAANAEISRRV
jgi:hypothetical protein